jgi:hypothetical protein
MPSWGWRWRLQCRWTDAGFGDGRRNEFGIRQYQSSPNSEYIDRCGEDHSYPENQTERRCDQDTPNRIIWRIIFVIRSSAAPKVGCLQEALVHNRTSSDLCVFDEGAPRSIEPSVIFRHIKANKSKSLRPPLLSSFYPDPHRADAYNAVFTEP